MNILKDLEKRSGNKCELCGSAEDLSIYEVAPVKAATPQNYIHVCAVCKGQIEDQSTVDVNHWRCLNDSMWSTEPAVQVMAWRMLNRIKNEGWPQDLLDMLYLDEETKAWAAATGEGDEPEEDQAKHLDTNGVELFAGDSVVVIKDLKVKGGGFTAKRGTPVRNISLVYGHPDQIEGRVEGQTIVLLTQYIKK